VDTMMRIRIVMECEIILVTPFHIYQEG